MIGIIKQYSICYGSNIVKENIFKLVKKYIHFIMLNLVEIVETYFNAIIKSAIIHFSVKLISRKCDCSSIAKKYFWNQETFVK